MQRAVSVLDPSSCAGRGVAPEPADEDSTKLADTDDRDWLLLMFVSLQNTVDWLLLELGVGSGAQSSSGCFFSTSAKHLEQRFMVLLDPQNPQGQRGGILGGLLRSLPVSPIVVSCLYRLILVVRPGMRMAYYLCTGSLARYAL